MVTGYTVARHRTYNNTTITNGKKTGKLHNNPTIPDEPPIGSYFSSI